MIVTSNDLSNRASAQVRRRLKDYLKKKEGYQIKSFYAKYVLEKFRNYNKQQLKELTLPLIASFLVTDGHVTVRKKKEMDVLELGFSNKNLELINAFNDLIYLTFNEVPSSIEYGELVRTRYVASWHNYMIKELIEYAYLDGKKDIGKFLQINKEILFECLRIAMSCDGFVTFMVAKEPYLDDKVYYRIRGSIELGCKPLKLRSQWEKVTELLGYNFKIKTDRIKCTDYNTLEEFYKLGGFLPNCFICGDSEKFEGIEKNKMLDALIMIKKEGRNNIVSSYDVGKLLKERVAEILR